MTAKRRFLVAGSETEPIRYETCSHGPLIDVRRYRTRAEAETEAEDLMTRGWRGVAIQEYGAVVARWVSCTVNVRTYTGSDGRVHKTHYCGRHDLLDDGLCPEHSATQTVPPAAPLQLSIDCEASR